MILTNKKKNMDKRQLALRVSSDLLEDLKKMAKKNNRSLSNFIETILLEYTKSL